MTQPWSFQDRIRVLAGLCEVLKSSPAAADLMSKVNAECEKLSKISAKNSFREADFMKVEYTRINYFFCVISVAISLLECCRGFGITQQGRLIQLYMCTRIP
jgi:hypothetical protein